MSRLLAIPLPLLALAALAAPGAGSARAGGAEADSLYAAWRPLLADELARRRIDAPDDLYKFLQQGVDGPRHVGMDEATALAWLEREWQELAAGDGPAAASPPEPLLEPLRPDGALARLNLGPLRELVAAAGPAAERPGREAEARRLAAAAFVATMRQARAPAAPLVAALWTRAAADTALWGDRLEAGALAEFTSEVEAAGWPAVHHSRAYAERWRPHYRVVDPALLPASWRVAGRHAPGHPGGR